MYMWNAPQPCHYSTKLRVMTISIQTNVVNKFEGSQMMCEELRVKKLGKLVYTLPYTCEKLIVTHTEHNSTMSPLNKTQNYDYPSKISHKILGRNNPRSLVEFLSDILHYFRTRFLLDHGT